MTRETGQKLEKLVQDTGVSGNKIVNAAVDAYVVQKTGGAGFEYLKPTEPTDLRDKYTLKKPRGGNG